MELEPAPENFSLEPDRRPRLEEPPPVSLVAVADVRLPVLPYIRIALDAFYVSLLRFEPTERALFYRADNFFLYLDETPAIIERDSLRPLGIIVPSLAHIEQQMIERELEYERQRSMDLTGHVLLVKDPAGNYLAISEHRII